MTNDMTDEWYNIVALDPEFLLFRTKVSLLYTFGAVGLARASNFCLDALCSNTNK